jgi:hypothetical protein
VSSLDLNAGTIHLLVLIAGLVVTGGLAAITWRYRKPRSTEPLPPNPEPDAELEVQAAIHRELRTQVAFLSSLLDQLPPAESSRLSEAMLNGDDLRDFPFVRFRTLASEIDAATDSAAALVETNMRWLGDLIRETRSLRSGIHYDWKKFPRTEYNEMIRVTRRPLRAIAQHLGPRDKPPD